MMVQRYESRIIPLQPSQYLADVSAASGSDWVIVDTSRYTSWLDLQKKNPNAKRFKFRAGDYRSWGPLQMVSWGPVKPLTGSVDSQVVFAGPDALPWQTNQRVIIQSIDLWECHHWIIAGITLADSLVVRQDSSDIVSHECFFDRAPGYCVRVFGQRVTAQRIYCRDQSTSTDAPCFQIQPVDKDNPPVDTKFLDCEIRNYNDGVGTTFHKTSPHVPINGTIIDGFDIFLTPDKHLRETGGIYADAENAMDFKIGTDSSAHPMLVTNNRISGFRFVAPSVAGGGKGSNGAAITNHFASQNVLFRNNVVFDCPIGWVEHQWTAEINIGSLVSSRGTRLENNIWYGIKPFSTADIKGCIDATLGLQITGDVYIDCESISKSDVAAWVPRKHEIKDCRMDGSGVDALADALDERGHNQRVQMSVLVECCRLSGPHWMLLTGRSVAARLLDGSVRL